MQTKRPKIAFHGFINLNKPLGITSADAVNKVKRLIRPSKIGHAGTLDPLATGVLPLALGEGTKCINLLMDAKKTYEFSVTFGARRSTDDAEGEVVATSTHIPTEPDIRTILPCFTGGISQIPPIYSALKVDGKRAYDLARAGEAVELKAREVVVYNLEYLGSDGEVGSGGKPSPLFGGEGLDEGAASRAEANLLFPSPNPLPQGERASPVAPSAQDNELGCAWRGLKVAHFRATVSKGTYIRSLGRDMAQALGSEGYISRLHRSAVGPFSDSHAISLDFLEESVHKAPPSGDAPWLTPLERALDDIPALSIDGGQLTQLRHGQRVTLTSPLPDVPQISVLHEGKLVGLARVQGNQVIPVRLLNKS